MAKNSGSSGKRKGVEKDFSRQVIFDYNRKQKRRFVFYTFLGIIVVLALITYYFMFFIDSGTFLSRNVNSAFKHITVNIKDATILGSFYASGFGGLFFLPVPLELVFLNFLRAGHFAGLLMGIYLLGILISYSINYWIGGKLTYASKKIISYKKFYKIKGFINKHGALGVFVFNVLPLPSQILSAILGVFNYNKTRFYVFTMAGQVTKYIAIVLGYFYIV